LCKILQKTLQTGCIISFWRRKIENEPRYPVKSLEKALSILELMILEGRDLALTDIAMKSGFGKGTVHRILGTLKSRRFVHQDSDTKKYGLGIRALEMGSSVKKDEILREAMRPALRELLRKCRETVNAAILEHDEIVYIYRLESEEPLRFSLKVGSRFPAHCTSTGKIMLADLSDQDLYKLYGGKESLGRLTENSIRSFKQFMEEIRDVRQKGLAFDLEETLVGVKCIAAAVRNARREVVAAISISGPKERMTKARMSAFAPLITEASEKISKELGFQ
jgi:IclR family KDG regulon transcriptional repressor